MQVSDAESVSAAAVERPGPRAALARPVVISLSAGFAIQLALIVSGVGAARILGVENRGQLALIVLFPLALTQFGCLGLPLAATYFIAQAPSQTRAILRTVLGPAVLQAVVLTALTAVVFLVVFGSASHEVRMAAFLTLAIVPATLGEQYGLAILQGRRRFRSFNVLRTLAVFLYSAGVAALFVAGSHSLVLVALAWTLAYVTSATITLVVVARSRLVLAGNDDGPELSAMVRFGAKSLLGYVSPIEYGLRLDQQVVGLALSRTSLGLYVVAQSFTNLPRFVSQSIGMVGYPTIAAESSAAQERRVLWQCFWLTAAVCLGLVLVLELLAHDLVELFYGQPFAGATSITRVLLVAALFWSLRRVLADCSRGLGRPMLGTVAEISLWVALLPLLPLLAATNGATGVAASLAIASIIAFVVILVPLVFGRTRGDALPTGANVEPTSMTP